MKTKIDPSALYWASFNRFELRLPGEAVQDIAQPGDAGPAVSYWESRIINEWPERCTPDAIRAELAEHGAWDDDELQDAGANWQRIIWIAAGNIAEEESPDCSAPVEPAKTKTVFRTYRASGEVIALFPEIPADVRGDFCLSYMHTGQHGAASPLVDWRTRPATAQEIAPLAAELECIGYRLAPVRRITDKMHFSRRHNATSAA